jgi:phosphoesterase RecJ-like protein
MNIHTEIVDKIKAATKIVITAHKSPDGDSIGSSIALLEFCLAIGKNAVICHPDPSPSFLNWLPKTNEIRNLEEHENEVEGLMQDADLIFCLDYNHPSRVGNTMQPMLENATATKIMIDHHLNPAEFTELTISEPTVCSTCQLIYELIDQSGNLDALNPALGTAIYLGIMTDTGSFRFPAVTSRTHEIIGKLIDSGVKHYEIHENTFDTNTLDRLRLRGYACSEKLEIISENQVAIISLTQDELNRFKYQKGDTEGLVNVALSIEGMRAAAFFAEGDEYIKISFRSKGNENPVNELSSDHFQGGGHRNAAGGRFDGNLSDAIALFKQVVSSYIKPTA